MRDSLQGLRVTRSLTASIFQISERECASAWARGYLGRYILAERGRDIVKTRSFHFDSIRFDTRNLLLHPFLVSLRLVTAHAELFTEFFIVSLHLSAWLELRGGSSAC